MQKTFLILSFLLSFFIAQAQTNPSEKEPVKSYFEAWKEKDSTARLAIIKSFWTKESLYNDPVAKAKGPEELNAIIGKFQTDFPNAKLSSDTFLQTGNFISWNWEIADSEHQLFLKGKDFVTLNNKGEITLLVGFF